jgi:hypothetical protein
VGAGDIKETGGMAIFITECAICHQPFEKNSRVLATSGVAFPPEHPLYPFCDTGLHQQCLLEWPHRLEFSSGYFDVPGSVLQTSEWNLICGPLMYGPYGRPGWPYYAEIRLSDWPVRIYSRFEQWEIDLSAKSWRSWCIPEISIRIEELQSQFPATNIALQLLLLPRIIQRMTTASEYRSRYIATVSLGLFENEQLTPYIPALQNALSDDHASVREAVVRILKRLQSL